MIEYLIFGFIDNAVMIIGALTGLEIENTFPDRFSKGTLTVVGAGVGNAFSDTLGGLGAMNIYMAIGTGLGCIIGLVIIPIVLTIKNKRAQV